MTCLSDGLKLKNVIFRWTKERLSENIGQMLICAWKQWLSDPQNSCFSLNWRHDRNEDDATALKSSEGGLDLMADRIWGLSASELELFLDISWDVVSQVCASVFKGLWSKKGHAAIFYPSWVTLKWARSKKNNCASVTHNGRRTCGGRQNLGILFKYKEDGNREPY